MSRGFKTRQSTHLAVGFALGAIVLCAVPLAGQTGALPEGSRGEASDSSVPDFRLLGSEAEPSENWRWWDGFSLPVLDGRVRALTVFRGDLIAAGSFEMAGGRRVNRVARWRDGEWQPLGAGFDGEVYALAVFQDRLIAGCQYTSSGGYGIGPVAIWDGERWSALGVPAEGFVAGIEVRALYVDSATLVVAGTFDRMLFRPDSFRVVEVKTSNIARWDGSAWSPIGAGFDSPVSALGSYRGDLIVAGDFMSSGPRSVAKIARWDGSEWRPLGDGIPSAARVSALAELRDTLYAGGVFDGGAEPLLRFDGTSWDAVPGSLQGEARALRVEGDSLIVVGSLVRVGDRRGCVQAWSGSSWSSIGETPWPVAESVTRYQGRLVCGGYLYSYWAREDEPVSHVVEWDGASWNSLERVSPGDRGLQGYVQALLEFQGSLVAAGSFRFMTPRGWSPTHLVARWDGERWSAMDESLRGSATCLARFRGDLIVGGDLHDPENGIDGIARWDGRSLEGDPRPPSRWRSMGPYVGGVVEALAVLRDTLYAAGPYLVPPTVSRFDGIRWQSIASSFSGYEIYSLGTHRGELFAGGQFDSIGGVAAHNVARWDGRAWHALGPGVSGSVNALASADSDLIVGGGFFHAGGFPAFGLALWNGSLWRPFPGVITQNTRTLWVQRGQVFACADLLLRQIAPGLPAGTDLGKIARWDGRDWHPLGSGANGRLMTLAEWDGDLFVGGDLTEVGGKASFRIARWALAPHASPGGSPAAWETAVPNPLSSQGTRLEFSLAEPADVRLSIHDLAGREVARPISGPLQAGLHVLHWSGSDDGGRRLPPGVYFARLAPAGKRTEVKRLILLK